MTNKSIRDYINLIENAQREGVVEGLNKTPLAQATVNALQAVLQQHPEWVEQYGASEVKRVTKYVTRGFWEAMNQDDIKGIVQNVGWELIASAEEEQLEETSPEAIAKINQITHR